MEIYEKHQYKGWNNCIQVLNNDIELIITTDIGPRIIRFGFKGEDNIFREFDGQMGNTGGSDWQFYGGHRFWHAPEAMPRTYCPDNNPVKYIINGNKIILAQELEEKTGIQKELEIEINKDKNYVKVVHRLINKNLWEIKMAPWALSVMAQGGIAIIPQEPYEPPEKNLLPVRPLILWSYTDMADPRWVWGSKYILLKQDPTAKKPQKIGTCNTHGWISYVKDENIFVKLVDYNNKKKYPDLGCNMEVYTNSDILELETLGSLEEVLPDDHIEHIEYWFLHKAGLVFNESSIDKVLIPFIERSRESLPD